MIYTTATEIGFLLEYRRTTERSVAEAVCSSIAAQEGGGWGTCTKQTAVSQHKMMGEDGACIVYK